MKVPAVIVWMMIHAALPFFLISSSHALPIYLVMAVVHFHLVKVDVFQVYNDDNAASAGHTLFIIISPLSRSRSCHRRHVPDM